MSTNRSFGSADGSELHHVVMFSGGVGSWATAKYVVNDHLRPGDRLTLLFADTLMEDPAETGGIVNYHESTLPRCDESMWPGFHYTDGPPPFATKRAHKPPGWPHDRRCWCGAREHSKQLPPGRLKRWQRWLRRG